MSNETENTSPKTPDEKTAKTCRTAEELAAEAVRIAKQELEKAQKVYEDLRQQAAEKFHEVREKKVGDVLDSTLEAVKKYPGRSLAVSVALGICVGRWIQKTLGR
jgi:ElaB/YqjD/DUF883 family membrane-anchored ribosome-binding protein